MAELKDTLNKQVEDTAQRMALEAFEVQNLNEVIRILKEQNAEVVQHDSVITSSSEQQLLHLCNPTCADKFFVNVQSTKLAQNTAESCATLKQELFEAKDALYKQTKESTYQMTVKTFEVQNLNVVINTLKEQIAEVENAVIFQEYQNISFCIR